MRCVRELQPTVFLLENVHGINYSGKEEGFLLLHRMTQAINEELGCSYELSWKVLDAADFGVPQTRARFFLIGHREGERFRFPCPTHSESPSASSPLSTEKIPTKPRVTAWDAIGHLSPERDEDLTLRGSWSGLVPSITEGENYLWHTNRKGGMPLFGWRTRYWSFLLKLAKDRPSWTIQAQPGPAIGPFHWKNRLLSKQELLALQTFPSTAKITGSRNAIQRQLGNAVPSLLAEVLAREILHQFFGASKGPCTMEVRFNRPIPAPEPIAPVPSRYRRLAGSHPDHPGTGKGNKALELGRSDSELDRQVSLPLSGSA